MNFKGLLIFKTVYDVKSLNKAAKILGYSQSNLTAHLNSALPIKLPLNRRRNYLNRYRVMI